MNANRFLGCLLGCILFASLGFAGYLLDLDYANFQGDNESSYVEIYVSIQRDALTYRQQGDTLLADFMVVLTISLDTEPIVADTFRSTDVLMSRDSLRSGQFFPFVFQYFMQPGDYSVRASLFQYGTAPEETILSNIEVRSFANTDLQVSDLQLASSVQASDEQSLFVKNGIQVLPNPTRFYGTQMPLFYYYFEAYGLVFDSTAADSLALFRTVLRADSDVPVRAEYRKIFHKNGPTAVLFDGFPIYTVPTGSYVLRVRVMDYATGKSATIDKRFFCYRPDDYAQGRNAEVDASMQSRLLQADIDILSVIEPDSAIDLMHYLFSSKREEKRIKAYTDEGKRAFLQEFWKQKELEEPGAANRYFARVAEADERYGYLNKRGWRTDRGRVLIMYGQPDNVVHRYEQAVLPDHEVWQYDRMEGGVEFVFMDKSGFGDLELVHSTKKGEINNPNWPSLAPSSIGNTDTGGYR